MKINEETKNLISKKLKQKRGITLIALVVTIIVLLILAGISIQMLVGEGGILTNAKDASDRTKEANAKEMVEMIAMESLDDNGNLDVEKFKQKIEASGGSIVDETDTDITVEMDGYEITIDKLTGKITGVEKSVGGIKPRVNTHLYQTNANEPESETKYNELVLTVDVTNNTDITEAGGTIEITVTNPNGEEVTKNSSVTGTGEASFKVDRNGTYTVTVTTVVDGITRTTTKEVNVTQIDVPEFSRRYGTIDVRFITGTANTTTEGTKANAPVITKNGEQVLTPVNFDSENNKWVEVDTSQSDWESKWNYSYTNTPGESKWANAVAKDENGDITGYFVWIPRYAYKITYYKDSLDGEIIGYSDSRGIVHSDGRVYTGEESNRRNAGDNYIVHPAFTNDVDVGGWDEELQGIWVAKYEISKEISNNDGTTWEKAFTNFHSDGNVLTTNAGNTSSTKIRVVSKPGVSSWRYIGIGKAYTNSESYNVRLNSHLMKNSEWGACCYLSYSNYGIGPEAKVEQNTNYTTGGSISEAQIYTENNKQSTTWNANGIYDMYGGAWEFLASYVNTGDGVLGTYGGSFATDIKQEAKSNNKVTVYINDFYDLASANLFGDATYETSTGKMHGETWHPGLYACFPSYALSNDGDPFFLRGSYKANKSGGIFDAMGSDGAGNDARSFRCVLAF